MPVSQTLIATYSATFAVWCQPATGCSSQTVTIPVSKVNPQAPIIQVNSRLICAGESVTLTAIGCASPAATRWSNGQTGNPLLVNPAQTTTFYAVCEAGQLVSEASNSIQITVSNPLSVTGRTAYAENETILLTATASQTAGVSYQWSGPNGFTATGATLQRIGATTVYSGTYSVTASPTTGCAGTASVVVTVTPSSVTSCTGVSVSIVAPASITAGQLLSLSAVVSPASTSAVYSWKGANSFTATTASASIPVTTTANSGTYSVTVTWSGLNGCTATATTTVTVLPASTTSCSGVSASIVAPTSITAGQTLSLSAVVNPGSASALYAWTGPGLTSTATAPTIPATTTAHSGTYSLKVTLPTGCTATASTNVTVIVSPVVSATDCNIRIVAKDATGTETDLIPRSTTATAGASSLTLSVAHLDGLSLTGYSYQWSRQAGTAASLPVGSSPMFSATAIGEYSVVLTSPEGSTCTAFITLRSKPCRQVAHTYNCGTTPATPVGNVNDPLLTNLAPGDTIRTGDFDVVVMTVSGGSGGWTGTGYTEIPYLKNTRIAVELKGAVVNDCYELVGGTVVSAYDPNWGGLQDVTQVVNLVQDAITQLIDIYANYTGTPAEREKIGTLNAALCARLSGNNQLTAEQKAIFAADCQSYQTASAAFTACYAANHPETGTATGGSGRVAAGSVPANQQVCTSPVEQLSDWNTTLSGIAPPASRDSNDILVGKKITILAKNDTLIIDELKIVFRKGYSFTYNPTARTVSVTAPGKPSVEYGIAIEKVTGIFKGFYRVDYLQGNPSPCTIADKKIGYENKKGATACEEGYLHHTDPSAYEEIYAVYPTFTITGSALALMTQRSSGKDPVWTGTENGYSLKLFVTDQTTTPQNRAAIAKAANKPGSVDINLWIDHGANGVIRYEYFYGSKIKAKNPDRFERFFKAWLQKIKPVPSMTAENPIAQVIAGIATIVDSIQMPRKYWDCNLTGTQKYEQLPWIADASGAPTYFITQEDWAYYCGLYNGTVNVIGGLPLFLDMLIDDQQRAQLWSDLKLLKDIEVSDQTVTKVFELVYNPAQKCATAYNRGFAIPTVFSLFVGIGELNLLGKAKSAISTLASMARKLPAVGVGIRKGALAGTLVLGMTTSAGAFKNIPVSLKAITSTVKSAVQITGKVEQLTDEVAAVANGLAATGNRGVLGASELAVEGLTKTLAGAEDLIIFQSADKLVMGVEIINQAQQKTFSALAFFSVVGGIVTSYVSSDPSTNNCSICTGRAMPTSLCTKLSTLSSRGGTNGRSGVEKLCSSIPDNSRLEAIADKLNGFSPTEVSAFLGDVNKTFGAAGLDGNLNKLSDLAYIDAWKVVYDARCAGVANCNENIKADWAVLTQVKSMLQDNAVLTALGNRAGLVEIIQKNERTPCNTCGIGGASYLNKMDVYLKDVEYFVENYQGIGGWTTVVGSQGIKNGGIDQVEATAFMLRVLHENPVEFESQVSGFEILTGVGRRRMDIQKHNGTIVECKSWDDNADTFADFVAGTSNSYQQFLAYLQVVPDLTKLDYWLDGRKLTGATNADKLMTARLKFQTLFQNKASEIFKEPINGGIGLAKCQQLFQIIDISDS